MSEPSDRPAGQGAQAPGGIRGFIKRHGRKFWWLHSAWALSLGIWVMVLAREGFDYARWLVMPLAGAWLLFIVFFRIVGSGSGRKVDGAVAKVRFVVMTYVLKNFYQGMLFFLLPFYWKSSTWGTPTFWFVVALAACTLLATLDVIFDHVLMRWRALASIYYLVAIFCCLNLTFPALLPGVRVSRLSLAAAAVSAIVFLTLHVRFRFLFSRGGLAVLILVTAAAVFGVRAARGAIPPVPYSLRLAQVSPSSGMRSGGVSNEPEFPAAEIRELVAVTDVASPSGETEPFTHVWRREGREIARVEPARSATEGAGVAVRLRSSLPADLTIAESGRAESWTVDVETGAEQLVGRASFTVMPARLSSPEL